MDLEDSIRKRISSPRNTANPGYLARLQSPGFLATDGSPTLMWKARRRLFAVPATDPIAASWNDSHENGLQSSLVGVLDAAQVAFTMVCPFGISLEQEARPPCNCGVAIVVTVRRHSLSVDAAEDVAYELGRLLISFGLDSVGVEICEAEVAHLNSAFKIPGIGYTFDQVYRQPILGTSIGPSGDSAGAGSLGFYIQTKAQGSTQVFAVTCHHVVAPGKENPVHSRNFPTAVVESPSQMDHNAWTASLSRAADSKEAIHSFFSRMELPLPDMNLQRLRLQEKSQLYYDCRMDWALLQLAASRFPAGIEGLSNKPPMPLLESLFERGYEPQHAAAESLVFKMGRTTGATMGISSGCRAVIQVYRSFLAPVRSIEDVITPHSSMERFAAPGDSGALVYDAHGKGTSMIWGELQQKNLEAVAVGDVVFVTPIRAIIHDIQAKLARHTGCSDLKVAFLD